jgi:hypothetical protein
MTFTLFLYSCHSHTSIFFYPREHSIKNNLKSYKRWCPKTLSVKTGNFNCPGIQSFYSTLIQTYVYELSIYVCLLAKKLSYSLTTTPPPPHIRSFMTVDIRFAKKIMRNLIKTMPHRLVDRCILSYVSYKSHIQIQIIFI